jgi:antitoxin ParD1/3/4
MTQTQEFTVRLSDETAQFLRRKVLSGEFASESDVIRESLETFQQEAEELARWEREVVVRAYDEFVADPSSGIPIAEVEKRLAAKRLERTSANR